MSSVRFVQRVDGGTNAVVSLGLHRRTAYTNSQEFEKGLKSGEEAAVKTKEELAKKEE